MTTSSRRVADGLLLLVAHHWDLNETWVVPETEFCTMMRANTDYFNPMVPRNLNTIAGEDFNGYLWFNKHIHRISRENSDTVDYLKGVVECFSGFDFGRALTIPNHEGYDRHELDGSILFSMVRACNLHPHLLTDLHLVGFDTSYPWQSAVEELIAEENPTVCQTTEGQVRPMWLL